MTKKEIIDQCYTDFIIKEKKPKAERAKPIYEKLAAKGVENGKEFWDCLNALCDYKYINRREKGSIYYLDVQKLDEIFTKIESDERVSEFDKLSVLFIIDLYYDLRIKLTELNKQYGVKGKNRIFNTIKNSIIYNESEPDMSKLSQNQYENYIAKLAMYTSMQETMIKGREKAEEIQNVQIDSNEVNELLKNVLTGTKMNVRKIELFMFPLFYNHLVLRPGNELPTKKLLLWDIMTIILLAPLDQVKFKACTVNEDKYELMTTIIGE